ncbi:hypothetical protein CMV_025503 [Castanea mollissima]|uniref:Methyltransferase n=1 Tax=Castanea mollissima TaxID=60419 RepID=A0A8J4QLH4_9ROSI|nr:hypothetical protein CMV_025503 [Castanea mollissima]
MAITVPNLIKERNFPFILTLSVLLLLCFAFLIFTNTKSNQSLGCTQWFLLCFAFLIFTKNDGVSAAAAVAVINADPNSPRIDWKLCKGTVAVDFIPCLDNFKALKARRHMEHRERHCPDPNPRCLVPLPSGYRIPLPWPKSRDMVWYNNVPHPKLVEYKKDQNWVRKSGDFLVFPGGGTQFKDGVISYVEFIERTLPTVEWGRHIRVILDVGCGVASFGGYLLDKNVITMSFAPKDEHEAQIQFALKRGIPATLVHWDADGGKPLLELNRILRPGGFFVWSATPVYRDNERDQNIWKAMVALTKSICWKVVARTIDSSGIGLKDGKNSSWYVPLSHCLSLLPVDSMGNLFSWPVPWPKRLSSKPPSLSTESGAVEMFYEDTKHWSDLVSDVYLNDLAINWSSVRNVMDMNAHYGGFAAALIDLPVRAMNVIPIDVPDTLSIIFDRGLIGIYHDWCESLNTYPRTYDLLHSRFLFRNLTQRCDVLDVIVEMDRILRPGGYIVVQDNMEIINKLSPILHSLHWSLTLYKDQFLVGKKGFWRPTFGETKS